MTDTILQKALALVNEVAQDVRYEPDDFEEERRDVFKALCRAIEQHEAYKREVSDAVTGFDEYGTEAAWERLSRFIIPKPDPLVEVLSEAFKRESCESEADQLRAAMLARGYEFTKIGEKAGD